MPDERVYIIGDYGLKSPEKYDFSRNITDTTHLQISFSVGEDNFFTIISTEDLFELLKDRLQPGL